MPRFSTRSRSRLHTCDERLVKLFNEVVKHFDCTIIEGHRGKEKQNEAYRKGNSKLKFPNGKHNKSPSIAVDVAPILLIGLIGIGFIILAGSLLELLSRWD